ncbi:MAG: hypothetical protein WB626_04520 [Bacteroidota bacterium]
MRGLLPVCLAALLLPPESTAQLLGEKVGPQNGVYALHARTAGMADAAAALPFPHGAHAVNPAILAWVRKGSAEVDIHRMRRDASMERAGVCVPAGRDAAVALDVETWHGGGLDSWGGADPMEITGSASYGTMVTEDLSCGLTLRLHRSTQGGDPANAVSAGAGLGYAPDRRFRFGCSLMGTGTDYRPAAPPLGWDRASPRGPRVLALGSAFLHRAGDHTLLFAYQSDMFLGERGVLYRAGMEWEWAGLLAARTGVLVRGGETEARAGLGLRIGAVRLDYAARFSRLEGGPSGLAALAVEWP